MAFTPTKELEAELERIHLLRKDKVIEADGLLDWDIDRLEAILADRKETHFDEMVEFIKVIANSGSLDEVEEAKKLLAKLEGK
jgi:predicted transcriptional regulator